MKPVIYSNTLIEGNSIELYDGITGESYDSYVWQGVRPYLKEYIFVGTATTAPYSSVGLVAIGDDALAFHSNVKTFAINCLNNAEEGFTGPALNTSIYGPNVVGKNIFNLVGTYNNIKTVTLLPKIYGFFYTGKLKFDKTALLNPSNYKTIPTSKLDMNITFAHSMSNNHIVLNGGNLPSSIAESYIYNSLTEEFTLISIKGYKTVTTYGILFNEPKPNTCQCSSNSDEMYTLVGGCSEKEINISSIYDINSNAPRTIPYGSAFILQYNMTKKKINSIKIFRSVDTFIHFQGISFYFNNPDVYNVATDVLLVKGKKLTGYVKKIKQTTNSYKEESSVTLSQNLSANSVANNVACGIYEESGTLVPYQASF